MCADISQMASQLRLSLSDVVGLYLVLIYFLPVGVIYLGSPGELSALHPGEKILLQTYWTKRYLLPAEEILTGQHIIPTSLAFAQVWVKKGIREGP